MKSFGAAGESIRAVALVLLLGNIGLTFEFHSHRPMRTTPPHPARTLTDGPARFVDAIKGNDSGSGSETQPWKTLQFALRQVKPGETLYLREGTFYEHPVLSQSGTADAPITIQSYPGESAVIDGGQREFLEDPESSWEPVSDGAPDEFVSTRTYHELNDRRVPQQFLPGGWEPLWGIEDERPLALGHFSDSMIPLHGYRHLSGLRAENQFWLSSKNDRSKGIYCGPGLWFNRQTGRVHVRMVHHTMPGLDHRAYRGETDPRRIPLHVSIGFGDDVLRISGIRHVRLRDLTLRGATGSPMIHVYGSEDVELDHVNVFGGFPALLVNASRDLRVTHCAFRGLAAPWSGRAHMKYLGTPSYQIVLQNNRPLNEDIEFSYCEFTDDHDFAFLRYAKNLRMHHCLVDHFNDDGLECGSKLRDHSIYIYQNRIGACLGVFQQHEIDQDESPADHTPGTGVYVFRNVIDTRAGVPYQWPREADPSGEFLHAEGHLLSDHGSPIYPVMRFYHNTFVRQSPVFRGYFLFGLGAVGLRQNERDVFNNIFVQNQGIPGPGFVAIKEAGQLREGGNILWSPVDGPNASADVFEKFRSSPLFQLSQQRFKPGWTTLDHVVDPGFVRLTGDRSAEVDLRLKPDSPARDSGLAIPTDWPDPLRQADSGNPDIGAIAHGMEPWSVGVDGRINLFTGKPERTEAPSQGAGN